MPLPGDIYPNPGLYPGGIPAFTEQLLESTQFWNDPHNAWQTYNALLAAMFEPVAQIVQDSGFPDDPGYVPGWSVLLDPDNCPTQFLPYLAQFVGVTVQPGTDDASARATIKAESGFQRGTRESIIAAAKRWLSGTQAVYLLERQGVSSPDPYHFVIVVRTHELLDRTQLIAAVDATKPAGLQWTLVVTEGWTWNQAIHKWQADTMTWDQTASIQP